MLGHIKISLILLLIGNLCIAQVSADTIKIQNKTPENSRAQYKDGIKAFKKMLVKTANCKTEEDLCGKNVVNVVCKFTVLEDGSMTGFSVNTTCKKTAERILSAFMVQTIVPSIPFTPAYKNGIAVKEEITLELKVKLK
jgi:hypothetical protein